MVAFRSGGPPLSFGETVPAAVSPVRVSGRMGPCVKGGDRVSADASSVGRVGGRVAEYDLVRVVSISLVILIHVIAPFVGPEAVALGGVGPVALLSRLLRFAVPAFIMLTGALVWTRPGGGGGGWRRFYGRRTASVVVPYLVWSAVFIVVGALLDIRAPGSVRSIARGLLLGTTWYHLYFVPAVLGIYVLAPVASALFKRSVTLLLAAATVAGIVVPTMIAQRGLAGSAPFALVSLVCAYLPYAASGAWYASVRGSGWWTRVERWGWPLFLAAGLGLRVWYTLLDTPLVSGYVVAVVTILMNVLPTLGVLGLARRLVERSPRVASRAVALAPAVFGVYLVHPLGLLALERLAAHLLSQPAPVWLWAPIVWTALTVAAFALVGRAVAYPRLWWLHGAISGRATTNSPARR